MKRENLSKRLESRWRELHDSYSGLSREALLKPGVVGDWSIRDVFVHVASWDGEALTALPVIVDGGRVPRYSDVFGGIDAFNALTQERKASLNLEQVTQELEDTHQRLVDFLEGVPDAAFATEGRFLKRLRQDTYGHYREHAEQINAWREKFRA